MAAHTTESLSARLNAIVDFVRAASENVDAGELVNLGDLDLTVAALCNDVESSNLQTAQQVASLMGAMTSALEDLARALKDFQDRAEMPG